MRDPRGHDRQSEEEEEEKKRRVAKRKAEEDEKKRRDATRKEAETRKAEEEEKRRRDEEEKRRRDEEDERRRDEEKRRREEEEEKRRRDENARRMQTEENARRIAAVKKKAEETKELRIQALEEQSRRMEEKERLEKEEKEYDENFPRLPLGSPATSSSSRSTPATSSSSRSPPCQIKPPKKKIKVTIVSLGTENVIGSTISSLLDIFSHVPAPESLGGRWPRKTLLLDCHLIWKSSQRPPNIGSHIGSNPIILGHILGNEGPLAELEQMLVTLDNFLSDCERDGDEIAAIVCFCKWGKHRSVGGSWCIQAACQKRANVEVTELRHMNRLKWGRHSCGRVHCEGCDDDSFIKQAFRKTIGELQEKKRLGGRE